MTARSASCRCGQLKAAVNGEPVRVSICHCLNCKKRSGSAFAAQARWPAEQVAFAGEARSWSTRGDSGNLATFHFCPQCGSEVYYQVEGELGHLIAIPLGVFDEPFFPAPDYSVFEDRKPEWLEISGEGVEHFG